MNDVYGLLTARAINEESKRCAEIAGDSTIATFTLQHLLNKVNSLLSQYNHVFAYESSPGLSPQFLGSFIASTELKDILNLQSDTITIDLSNKAIPSTLRSILVRCSTKRCLGLINQINELATLDTLEAKTHDNENAPKSLENPETTADAEPETADATQVTSGPPENASGDEMDVDSPPEEKKSENDTRISAELPKVPNELSGTDEPLPVPPEEQEDEAEKVESTEQSASPLVDAKEALEMAQDQVETPDALSKEEESVQESRESSVEQETPKTKEMTVDDVLKETTALVLETVSAVGPISTPVDVTEEHQHSGPTVESKDEDTGVLVEEATEPAETTGQQEDATSEKEVATEATETIGDETPGSDRENTVTPAPEHDKETTVEDQVNFEAENSEEAANKEADNKEAANKEAADNEGDNEEAHPEAEEVFEDAPREAEDTKDEPIRDTEDAESEPSVDVEEKENTDNTEAAAEVTNVEEVDSMEDDEKETIQEEKEEKEDETESLQTNIKKSQVAEDPEESMEESTTLEGNNAAMEEKEQTPKLEEDVQEPSSRKRSASPSASNVKHKRFQNIAVNLVNSIEEHRFSSPFLHPINSKEYDDLIYDAKDLKGILRAVKQKDVQTYETIKELERDIMLMFANCVMYNKSNTHLVGMARQMKDEIGTTLKMFEEAESEIGK